LIPNIEYVCLRVDTQVVIYYCVYIVVRY
jgi:hypothetical protein